MSETQDSDSAVEDQLPSLLTWLNRCIKKGQSRDIIEPMSAAIVDSIDTDSGEFEIPPARRDPSFRLSISRYEKEPECFHDAIGTALLHLTFIIGMIHDYERDPDHWDEEIQFESAELGDMVERAEAFLQQCNEETIRLFAKVNGNKPIRLFDRFGTSYAEFALSVLHSWCYCLLPYWGVCRHSTKHKKYSRKSILAEMHVEHLRWKAAKLPKEYRELIYEVLMEWRRTTAIARADETASESPQDGSDTIKMPKDGPIPPRSVRIKGKVYRVETGRAFRVLRFFWGRDFATVDDVISCDGPEAIFTSEVQRNTVDQALLDFRNNAPTRALGWTLFIREGVVVKEGLS